MKRDGERGREWKRGKDGELGRENERGEKVKEDEIGRENSLLRQLSYSIILCFVNDNVQEIPLKRPCVDDAAIKKRERERESERERVRERERGRVRERERERERGIESGVHEIKKGMIFIKFLFSI